MFMMDARPSRAFYRDRRPEPLDERKPRRMKSSHDIVLGVGKAPPPPDAAAEAERAAWHWRRWRRGGVWMSVGFHLALALLLAATLPKFGAEARKDVVREKEPLPVEIVTRAPEPDAPKKEPEPEKPKAERPPPVPEVPKFDQEKQPDAAKPVPPPPQSAPEPAAKATPAAPPAPKAPQKAAPPPAPATPPAPPAAAPGDQPTAPARPQFAWNAPPAPPSGDPESGDLGPSPRAAPPPGEGLKLEADVVALPESKEKPDKNTQYWVLDPLRIDVRNGCGVLVITGTMALNERVSEGVYRGTIQTTTRTAQPTRVPRCAAQSSLYRVEVRFEGDDVSMLGAGGFSDRGVQRNGVMMLEDAYGRSIWRKR